jgi:hypothetical protein
MGRTSNREPLPQSLSQHLRTSVQVDNVLAVYAVQMSQSVVEITD